jgi:hypothetical protein
MSHYAQAIAEHSRPSLPIYVHLQEQRVAARHLFLMVIEQQHQPVFESLVTDVLPHYQADNDTLDGALFEWGTRFHLIKDGIPAQWVEFQVMKTVSAWAQYPCTQGKWHILIPPLGFLMGLPSELSEIRIIVDVDGQHTPRDTLKRANAEVAAHMEKLRKYAETEGLQEQRPMNVKHFSWAARFQVGGESIPDIAATTYSTYRSAGRTEPPLIDERTVRLAVRTVLKFIQLDRRREQPGPKRGSSRRSANRCFDAYTFE